MPILDVIIDPTGAVSGGKEVEKAVHGMTQKTNQFQTTLSSLKKMMATVFTAYAIKNVAQSFLDTATEMENYRVRLRAVIKDQSEADKVFGKMVTWAAEAPITTAEAIGAFVQMKAAAVANAEEATLAVANLASVMNRDMRDVAASMISGETEALRRLGVIVQRNGKEAVVQSGQFRRVVKDDMAAIRSAIIEITQLNYPNALAMRANTFSGVTETILGQLELLRMSVMGTADSNGPFAALLNIIKRVRDEFNAWVKTEDYQKFVSGLSSGITGVIKTMGALGSTLASGVSFIVQYAASIKGLLLLFAAFKGSALFVSTMSKIHELFLAGAGLIPGYTSLISKLGNAYTMFGVTLTATHSKIGAMKAALTALGLTPGGAVLIAIGTIIALAEAMDDTFDRAAKGLFKFNTELAKVDSAKLREIVDSSRTMMNGWREGTELAIRQEKAVASLNAAYTMQEIRLKNQSKWSGAAAGTTGAGATKSNKSAAELLVENIQNKMKYLFADGKAFLPILDAWAAKLKPLSKDWRTIVDLQREIRNDAARKVADETAVAIKANEVATAYATQLAASKGVGTELERQQTVLEALQKSMSEDQWGNAQGIIPDKQYLQSLIDQFNKLKAALNPALDASNFRNWTPEMKSLYESIIAVQKAFASLSLDMLKSQFDAGHISLEQYRQGLEGVKNQFAQYPAVVAQIELAIKGLDNSISLSQKTLQTFVNEAETALKDKLASVPDELSGAFAGAIAYSNDLGEALQQLARDIAYAFLKAVLLKSIFSFLWIKTAAASSPVTIPGLATSTGSLSRNATSAMSSGASSATQTRTGNGDIYNITMNVNAIDSQSFQKALESQKATISSVVVQNIRSNGAVRKAIQGA